MRTRPIDWSQVATSSIAVSPGTEGVSAGGASVQATGLGLLAAATGTDGGASAAGAVADWSSAAGWSGDASVPSVTSPGVGAVDWSQAQGPPTGDTGGVGAVDWSRAPGSTGVGGEAGRGAVDWSALESDAAGGVIDVTFRHPHLGRDVSARELLGALRAAGIKPHPWGEEADEQVLASLSLAAADAGVSLPFGAVDVRSRVFGVDRAQFPFDDATPPAATQRAEYGMYGSVLADVATLGGGFFREGATSDLIWHHIFPYEWNAADGSNSQPGKIPKPGELLENLRADDYSALSQFSWVLFVALMKRVQLFPTVFARGGGEGLNSDPHLEKDVPIFDPTVQLPVVDGDGNVAWINATAPDGTTWADCILGKPAHQNSVLIPSVWGWDEWYWDPIQVLVRPAMPVPEHRVAYQHYCLNLYNAMDEGANRDVPASTSTYAGMVAVRKSLGVAAFGQGIGEALAKWEGVLAGYDLALSDYVPHLEFGAEMDEQWAQLDEVPGALSGADQIGDLEDRPLYRASAREYARFHGVLAHSIQAAWPAARFKASEISSWATIRQSGGRSAWLGWALTEGLRAEVAVLNQAVAIRAGRPRWADAATRTAAAEWVAVSDDPECGFVFPAVTLGTIHAPDLVHRVGFHYFHYWNPGINPVTGDPTDDLGYQNESDTLLNTLEPFWTWVVNRCNRTGAVTWGVGNVGFPSGVVPPDFFDQEHASAFGAAADGQMVQAGVLVRLLLTFAGYGAEHVLWFSHMTPFEGGGEFSTMGLRNDELLDSSELDISAGHRGWEKASYWALQRVIDLAARADAIEVVQNSAGLVLIRLTASALGFIAPGTDRLGGGWRYAFIPWLDGAGVELPYVAATMEFTCAEGFDRMALVPTATSYGSDASGSSPYAVSTTPEWDDADPGDPVHFGNCTQEWAMDGDTVSVRFYKTMQYPLLGGGVRPHQLQNLGLVAWFTNASTCKLIPERG